MKLNRAHVLCWSAIVLLLAPSVLLSAAVVRDVVATTALRRDSEVSLAMAEVTGMRGPDGRGRLEVQYAFSLADSAMRYTASDGTGRSNLWIQVTREAAESVRKERVLPVRYLKHNPSVNRPRDQAGQPLLDVLTGATFSLVGWVVLLGGPVLAWRNARLIRTGTAVHRGLGQWFWIAGSPGEHVQVAPNPALQPPPQSRRG